jgi:DUF1016 N-terminal domain
MAKKNSPSNNPQKKPRGKHLKATKPKAVESSLDVLYSRVRDVLTLARDRAWQAVNTVMVEAYWQVGRIIVEDEQAGKGRADYGKHILENLAQRLTVELGKGFDQSNLRNMRSFFQDYPIRDALRRELSWAHYRLLMRVDKLDARAFYEAEAVNAHWSTPELERQISSQLFERLALSRDKAGILAWAQKGHEISRPSDLVKQHPGTVIHLGLKWRV